MPRHRDETHRRDEGDRLRRLRERLGLSQRELASEFNVTAGAIAQWETGDRTIAGPTLVLLELYEREVGLGRMPAKRSLRRASPKGAVDRTARAAVASALWLGMQTLLGADEGTIAARTRLALAKRLTVLLGSLRGLSMKLGQLASYVDTDLPEREAEMLATLQDRAPPMPPGDAARVVSEELGKLPAHLFATWSAEPVAAASIGQVHQATLHSGEKVAVKVQYPGMLEVLKQDLRHAKRLDTILSLFLHEQEPGVVFKEMAERFLDECNYVNEARWQTRFREAFAGDPNVVVPEVIGRLSSARVLTSRFCEGASFERFLQTASHVERGRAALTVATFTWESILRRGWFNADPHPGNLLFDGERVVFLDFGRVQEFPAKFIAQWKAMVRALLERNPAQATRICVEMGAVSQEARFDFDYLHKSLIGSYRPWLTDRFRFTPDHQKRVHRLWLEDNVNLRSTRYTAPTVFFYQLTFGLGAVLARLNVEAPYRAMALPLLYAPGDEVPPPFSTAELRTLGLPD
jgi:transcriptional regulator with XRE-family HTH domain